MNRQPRRAGGLQVAAKVNINALIAEAVGQVLNEKPGENALRDRMATRLSRRYAEPEEDAPRSRVSFSSFDEDPEIDEAEEEEEGAEGVSVGSEDVSDVEGEPGDNKPELPKMSKQDVQEPTIDRLVSNLNTFRAGKSLKDEQTVKNLELYFDGLTRAEKQAMLAYTYGLAQVVTVDVSGRNALTPAKLGLDVRSKKSERPKPSREPAPEVEVATGESQQEPSEPQGLTTGPIVVGESRQVRALLSRSIF